MKSRGLILPRAAMGRWQCEALTKGLWRNRRRPSTPRFASGRPPHGFATGRIFLLARQGVVGFVILELVGEIGVIIFDLHVGVFGRHRHGIAA